MKEFFFKTIEIIFFPITIIAGAWISFLTKGGMHRTVLAEKIFLFFNVLPIRDHYDQPLINPRKHLKIPLGADRNLPGINFNDPFQISLLASFDYNEELINIPVENIESDKIKFYFNNHSFESGDAEFLYNIIRHYKPKKMIEIGSGFSTLISLEAFERNKLIQPDYEYQLICIEPFQKPWLEKTSASIIRQKVEDMDIDMFKSLNKNDILFIDSSHMIRPQGDVLFEILEILPILKPGVIIHFHDVFSPKDYLEEWVLKEHRLWNEQYLLEAFLSHNNNFEIIGAVNYLMHNYKEELEAKSPILKIQQDRQPGSFWIRKKEII